MRHKHSDYMHWAKTRSRARFNLATSGVAPFPLRELPYDPAALEINGDNPYGYAPLKQAIAGKEGVDPACVVTTAGTSFANHLAMATLLEPGDEVVIEQPAYELLVSTARYLGAAIKRFPGTDVRQAITPRTKLIVLTNLHNPTSALRSEAELRDVGDLARSVGAHVLVDEVYLDAVYDHTLRSAFHLGPEFVTTNSLTKVYGLSGLRCGWILAQPDLAQRMWQLNNLFAATPVHPGELLSVVALQHLDRIRARTRPIVEADRQLLAAVFPQPSAYGTTAFLPLPHGDVDAFLDLLRTKHETSAVPGRFFDAPDHFRIGMGVDHEMFQEGLRRLTLALEEWG